eukprot:m.205528 g.205528  ORF g.205528 m.205528 type:complete len:691 (+) comp18488_c0_seq2:247-2319(+)
MAQQNVEDFVNDKMQVKIPWDDLVGASNLQRLLHAIVQRLDRHDRTLADAVAKAETGRTPRDEVTVIPTKDLKKLQERLDTLENTTLQSRVEALKEAPPLVKMANKGKGNLKLSEHVIPLAQLKGRVEATEVGVQANAQSLDETNERLRETAQALHEELEAALANMVTKDEFKELEEKHYALEEKHEALARKVEQMFKDLVERLERMIKELEAKVDALGDRIDKNSERIDEAMVKIDEVAASIDQLVQDRIVPIEEEMPLKANKAEVEAAIQEIKDELAKINLDEIAAMAGRLDLLDDRCDHMEDEARDLKEFVMKFQQEMEDMQLEKQIEGLRRELEEAKTGVFQKATERMDAIQRDAEELREGMTRTQGQVQVNRESLQDIEDIIRSAGFDIGGAASQGGSTKALVAQLQSDVQKLNEKYSAAMEREAAGKGKAEETEQALTELRFKMGELANAKADREAVELALNVKADKEAVARDVEANQRAVDEALTTMNAGTQGIQQLLEQQEGAVTDLHEQLANKTDRTDLERLQELVNKALASGEVTTEQAEAMYGKYGVSPEDAALMVRPMQRAMCLSCERPLTVQSGKSAPALPLLPSASGRSAPYIPNGTTGRRPQTAAASIPNGRSSGDSLVELRELPSERRRLSSTGRRPQPPRRPSAERPVELVGEDGRVYHGRLSKTLPPPKGHS